MKKLIISIFILFFSISTFAQDSLNMKLFYNWYDTSLPFNTYWNAPNHSPRMKQYFNEIWGWHNPADNKEYAIMGAYEGVFIFDVTDTDSCYLADFIKAKDDADIHRDYKTYGQYLYCVADEGNNSLQIIDLSGLPNSTNVVYDSDEFVRTSHNIFIENGILFMVTPQTPTNTISGFRMLDIATDPEKPTLIADFTLPPGHGFHVHDMYVRDNIAYCSNGNDGFFIYDISNPNNITTLNSITSYDEQGYNHNGWLSNDGNTLYFADETHGLGIKSYDISDINNISQNTIFRSNIDAIPHNHFVKGDSLYVSYYHDGVYVFNIENPKCPYTVAHYDTYQEKYGYYSYQGAWGVYPYLPSGTILVSDFENGLFVLGLENTTPITPPLCTPNTISEQAKYTAMSVYPNPAQYSITINLPPDQEGNLSIFNSKGQKVISIMNVNDSKEIDISEFLKGIYKVNFQTQEGVTISKTFLKY